MLRKSIILIISAGLFFLFSCAEPIDRDLIQVAEDIFPPEVLELSPDDNSLYYSEVVVEGIVEDNSLFGGDGAGRLISIAYTLSNNYNRRGKILIDNNGLIQNDTDFGNGEILFDSDTGQFSFTFSTIEFERGGTVVNDIINGYMTIYIDFEDANGNIVREQINLRENSEPYLNLIEPGTIIVNYQADDNIEIYGHVANSSQDFDDNNEIVSLEWILTMMPNWRQKIDLTVLSPEPDGHYEIQSTEDAIGIPLFSFYPDGVTGTSLPGNPEQAGYFYSLFVAPQIVGNLSFRFDVVDKRGGEISESVDIASKLLSPVFSNLAFSGSGVHYNASELKYYYSSVPGILSPGDVVFNGRLSDNGPVPAIKYKIRTNGVWLSEKTGKSTVTNNADDFSFSLDISDLQTSSGNYSQVRIEANNGDGTGYGTKILYDDHLSPNITVNNFNSNNSNNSAYAKLSDSITLSFNVTDVGGVDGVSGLSGTPTVTIATHPVTPIDNGNGNWTATYVMGTISDTGINNNFIPYTISIFDNVNNQASSFSSGNEIKYYETNPIISSIFASTDVPTAENPEWIKANENIIISYTVNRDLLSIPIVSISGNNTTTTGNPGPDYESEYVMLAADDDNSGNGVELTYSISVTDKAGNAGSASGNTSIWFDRTDPLAPNSLSSIDLAGSYISGLISDFDIDVDLTGSNAKVDDTVELLLNGSNAGFNYTHKLLLGEDSAYTFDPVSRSDLGTDGSKSFTARVIDLAGNVGPQSSPAFTKSLDTAPPSITINTYNPNLSNNSRIRESDPTTIAISSTITDTNGISGIPTIQFGSGSPQNMTNPSGDIWTYTWIVPATIEEDVGYLVQISATDLVSNNVIANGRTFILDNVLPVTPTLSSSEIANGFVNGETAHEFFDIQVDYTSADIGDLVELAGLSGTYIHTLVSGETSSYIFTVDRDDLGSDGDKTITARLTDIAGNVGSYSTGFDITLDIIDPAMPTIDSVEITNGYVNGETPHEFFDIKVDYSSSEIDDIVELSGLVSGTYSHTLISGETSTYSFNVDRDDLGLEGNKTIRARLIDEAGNIGAYSTGFDVTLDKTDPAISLSYSTADTRISNTFIDTVTISATVTDDVAFSGTPTISIASGSYVNMINSWDHLWDVPPLGTDDGSYTIDVRAADDAGNITIESGRTFIVDNTAPAGYTVSAFSYLVDTASFTVSSITEGSSQVLIHYTISTDGSGSGSPSISDTTLLMSLSGGSVSYSFDASALKDGNLTIEVEIEDDAGNKGIPVSSLQAVVKPNP